ncbi:MAG: hypothetical protein OEW06_03565 [Gemmatimonadota bacterium]|nr:hypothetical protein [Gemmatimonadota bacterium]MDH4350982.1 hypothetical protein [Gemmatimonadota bacterium]
MRQSSAILSGTPVRLWDLRFPTSRVFIHRTRLAYIHLDNLLNFAKFDRDGRVDGYVVAYLPDEVAIVFIRGGHVVTAVALTQRERAAVPVPEAVQAMHKGVERGELAFCEGSPELLTWMYYAGVAPVARIPVDRREPARVFAQLQQEQFSGVVEFIVDGRVSFIQMNAGRFATGYFAEKPDDLSVSAWIERLLQPHADGAPPAVAVGTFQPETDLPEQASVALLEAAREVFWRLVEQAEREAPQDGMKRAMKLRDAIVVPHPPLTAVSVPRERPLSVAVMTPAEVTTGLALWTRQLLEQLEVLAPGAAPDMLRAATKDYRFLLQRAGFYGQLPWTVNW